MVEEKMYNLLAKQYANELSKVEQAELDAWLAVEDNAALAAQMHKLWQAAYDMAPLRIDKAAAWQQVKNIHAQRKARFKISAWAAAAALLMAVGVGYYYLPKADSKPQLTMTTDAVYQTGYVADTLLLPDGSQMVLLPNTRATVDKNYGKLNRIVTLQGTAHFTSVAGQYALTIINNQTRVEDISTAFWVSMQGAQTWVKVTQGAVKLWHREQNILLLEKDSATVIDNKIEKAIPVVEKAAEVAETAPITTSPVENTPQDYALDFNSTDLQTVVAMLNKHYNSKLEIGSQAIRGCKFTAKFKNESLETIVDVLQETFNLELNKSNNRTILLGKGCN